MGFFFNCMLIVLLIKKKEEKKAGTETFSSKHFFFQCTWHYMYQLGEQIVIYIIRMFFPCGSLKLQIRELHHVNWGHFNRKILHGCINFFFFLMLLCEM